MTSSLLCSDFAILIDAGGYGKLQDYLDEEFGETSAFASIAQKRTAACPSGHTSSRVNDGTPTPDPEDIIFQIRGGNVATLCGPGWRRPEYVGVPRTYFGFTDNCTDRWWTFQGAGAYGTGALSPANIYPLDGNRFVPGFDPAHIGGDNWSADAAISFIQNEPNWRGVMVSLGGIDKLGHMWGPEDEGEPGAAPGSIEEMRHLPFVAKNADEQVGRIVDALEASGLLDETLIVITADHAAQTGGPFHGALAPGVTNPLSDGNGARDRIRIRISRPGETKSQGIKVPVVFEHSPYRGDLGGLPNHPVDVARMPQEDAGRDGRATAARRTATTARAKARARARARLIPELPGSLDNYYVPRGYAVVLGENIGTFNSDGCPDVGARGETLGTKAVIDWLNGAPAPGTRRASAWRPTGPPAPSA